MDPTKIVLFILVLLLVIIIGCIIYTARLAQIIHGGNSNESDESIISRMKRFYNGYNQLYNMMSEKQFYELPEDKKQTIINAVLEITNSITGLNISIYEGNDPGVITLDWLFKSHMWKVVILQFQIKLIELMHKISVRLRQSRDSFMDLLSKALPLNGNIFGGALEWIAGFAIFAVGVTTILSIIGLVVIAVMEIVVAGVVATVGIATAGSAGIVLIAGIYAITNMYFNYQLKFEAMKLDPKLAREIATQDVSSAEMKEFMRFAIGGSIAGIRDVSVRGLDVINATARTALATIGTAGEAALGTLATMPVVVGGSWYNINHGSYFELGNIVVNNLINYNHEMMSQGIDVIYSSEKFAELILELEGTPAVKTLLGVLNGFVAIHIELTKN